MCVEELTRGKRSVHRLRRPRIPVGLGPTEQTIETARGGTTTLTPDLLAVLCLLAALILLFRYVQLFAEWRRRIFVLYAEAD